MSVKTKRVILALVLSVFLIFSTTILAHAYSSILAFGDSLSDNGIYQGYPGGTPGNINSNDTYGFYRYSNGPVWVEYLAGHTLFNVPLLDLAYGGATSGIDNPAASKALPAYFPYFDYNTGLQWQVKTYKTTFGSISSDTLVTIWAGANDMFQYVNGPDTVQAGLNKAAGLYDPDKAASNIALAIKNLILNGGQEFLVLNLPYNDSDPYKSWKQPFDADLAVDLAALKALYPEIDIYTPDMNDLVLTGIDYYTGTWLDQTYGPGTYRYYDGVHPTTEVHAQIAAYAAAATEVPEPSTMLLVGFGLIGLAGYGRKKFFKK